MFGCSTCCAVSITIASAFDLASAVPRHNLRRHQNDSVLSLSLSLSTFLLRVLRRVITFDVFGGEHRDDEAIVDQRIERRQMSLVAAARCRCRRTGSCIAQQRVPVVQRRPVGNLEAVC